MCIHLRKYGAAAAAAAAAAAVAVAAAAVAVAAGLLLLLLMQRVYLDFKSANNNINRRENLMSILKKQKPKP